MMPALRHIAPFVASLLIVLVTLGMTDLVRCADESAPVPAACADGAVKAPAPGAPDVPVGSHHNDAAGPDCLCHVTFVSTAVLPTVAERPALTHAYPAYAAAPVDGLCPLPGHVPLA